MAIPNGTIIAPKHLNMLFQLLYYSKSYTYNTYVTIVICDTEQTLVKMTINTLVS